MLEKKLKQGSNSLEIPEEGTFQQQATGQKKHA